MLTQITDDGEFVRQSLLISVVTRVPVSLETMPTTEIVIPATCAGVR